MNTRALVLIALLTATLSCHAGFLDWFRSPAPTKTSDRIPVKCSTREAEQELLHLLNTRLALTREQQVIVLIIEEKRRDLAYNDSRLTREFAMRRDRNYQFNERTLTLSELPNTPRSKPRVVKRLESGKDAQLFSALAGIKQSLQEDLTVLARLAQEKELALDQVSDTLKKRYSASKGREYRYDRAAQCLVDTGPAAAPAPPP